MVLTEGKSRWWIFPASVSLNVKEVYKFRGMGYNKRNNWYKEGFCFIVEGRLMYVHKERIKYSVKKGQ